jgi:hypothetical protein
MPSTMGVSFPNAPSDSWYLFPPPKLPGLKWTTPVKMGKKICHALDNVNSQVGYGSIAWTVDSHHSNGVESFHERLNSNLRNNLNCLLDRGRNSRS